MNRARWIVYISGALLISCVSGICTPAIGQGLAAGSMEVCGLLTYAAVTEVPGRQMYFEPEPMSLAGGAGAVCAFDEAQIIVFEGDDSETLWNSLIAGFGYADVERFPVPELGERAYSFYPVPQIRYQDTAAFVVVVQEARTVAVSVNAEEGQPAESVLPQAIQLLRIALETGP